MPEAAAVFCPLPEVVPEPCPGVVGVDGSVGVVGVDGSVEVSGSVGAIGSEG